MNGNSPFAIRFLPKTKTAVNQRKTAYSGCFGTPGETRTHYIPLRRRTLYPGEVRGLIQQIFNFQAQQDSNELPLRRRMLYPAELQRHFLFSPARGCAVIITDSLPKCKRWSSSQPARRKQKWNVPRMPQAFPRDKNLPDIFSRRASAPCAGLLFCLMHTFPLRSPPPQAFPGFQKNIRTAYRHFSLFLNFFKKVLAFCFSLCYNNQAPGSRGTKMNMGAFPSGQWGQTVNLLLNASVVRIHQLPPKTTSFGLSFLFSPVIPTAQ